MKKSSNIKRLALSGIGWLYRRLAMPAAGTIIVNSQGHAWRV